MNYAKYRKVIQSEYLVTCRLTTTIVVTLALTRKNSESSENTLHTFFTWKTLEEEIRRSNSNLPNSLKPYACQFKTVSTLTCIHLVKFMLVERCIAHHFLETFECFASARCAKSICILTLKNRLNACQFRNCMMLLRMRMHENTVQSWTVFWYLTHKYYHYRNIYLSYDNTSLPATYHAVLN